MKKLIILISLSLISHFASDAQNFNFIFNPKEASNNIDSIKANIFSTGESYFSKGSNEISFTITSVNINSISENVTVYPNPSYGQTQIQFYSRQNDHINIELINADGQIVASENQ